MRKELVVGSRSRRLNTLRVQQTLGGLLQTLLCASVESKRCWKGRGRAGPGVAVWDAASSFKRVSTSPQGSVRHRATPARVLN